MLKFILYVVLFYVIYKAVEGIVKAVSKENDKRRNDNAAKSKNKENKKIIEDDKGDFVDYEELD